jgi:serine/threonine protein kinase/tetratricopeptide (TPR) repeat protein
MFLRSRSDDSSDSAGRGAARERIGPYRIVEELGRGGMGVVYVAEDELLGRRVALKTLGGGSTDGRNRLLREARAAAGLNHPGICQVYGVEEEDGELWVAMELLEGQGLDESLRDGRLTVDQAVRVGLDILKPLGFLHDRGFVHRDLKPSNIFLTSLGLKLLDFGLTRAVEEAPDARLTQTATILGTPRYMAPEQWRAKGVGPHSDIFAFGAILYEMLAGRYAFEGDDPIDIFHAAAHEQPPPIAGAPGMGGLDSVVRRALAKEPGDRFPTTAALAAALESAHEHMRLLETTGSSGVMEEESPQVVRRLIALPFRVLRPDPDIDFLATSLPEAVGTSLAGLKHLVVRSTHLAPAGGAAVDLKQLAADVEVDYALSGTLMRGGERVRVNAQLLQVPSGTVVWSLQEDAPIHDLFQLQDDLTTRIVDGLAIPLSPEEEKRLARDAPASARAYELYLRGLHMAAEVKTSTGLKAVRDLLRGSVDADPGFAPAWALYGRACRVIAKYHIDDSERHQELAKMSFQRAFAVDPDSPIAHNHYTYFQLEESGEALGAMQRLLGFVAKGTTDANYWAGLVPCFRFAGLTQASFAAHERARALDPKIPTGVLHTHLMNGEYQWVLDNSTEPLMQAATLATLGRDDEALRLMRSEAGAEIEGLRSTFIASLLAALEGRASDCERLCRNIMRLGVRDPEAAYFFGRVAARAGLEDLALDVIETTVDSGLWATWPLENDPWLATIRARPQFQALIARAREGHLRALEIFRAARGPQLIGVEEAA